MWEGTGVGGCQYHCVCVCVCVQKKGGASTLSRHTNYACPLVCLACRCVFVGEVNICGSALIFTQVSINAGSSLIFNISNIKRKIKLKN